MKEATDYQSKQAFKTTFAENECLMMKIEHLRTCGMEKIEKPNKTHP